MVAHLIPVPKQLYERIDKGRYEIREFYWSIRIMSGRDILRFRKRIRDEAGEVLFD